MTAWWQGVPSALSWTGQSDPSTWTKVERYSLDKVFARTQTEKQNYGGSPVTTSYATNAAHFPTSVGNETRTVHHGFLNGDGTFYYRWDAWGRLTEVRDASNGTLRRAHLYDCEGRRVRTSEYNSSATLERKTRFVFMGMGLAASYVQSGTADVRTYGFVGGADGESFVVLESQTPSGNNGIYELARDFQGTNLALIKRTNPSSVSLVERYRYEPFGAVAIEDASGSALSVSAFKNERFFLGRLWDPGVGIYDIRARWYEPDSGSFLATDPLGAVDSWNFYQYGLAEPQTLADPFGMQLTDSQIKQQIADLDENIKAARTYLEGLRAQAGVPGQDECLESKIRTALDILAQYYRARDDLNRTVSPGPPDEGGSNEAPDGPPDWLLLAGGVAAAEPTPVGEVIFILMFGGWILTHPSPGIDIDLSMSDRESRKSDKEKKNDKPSWVRGKPAPGQSGRDFADSEMKRKYGENWREHHKTGGGTEHGKIQKWGDNGGKSKN